jgi:ATP/maltotriose-dependent transcriptional regulator MalT
MITPAIHHASPPEGLFEFRPDDLQLSRWKLTKRETEVVEGILLGLSNKEVAEALGMRLPTLKCHLLKIGAKLAIDSKRYALRTRIAYLMAQCPMLRIGAGRNDHPSKG